MRSVAEEGAAPALDPAWVRPEDPAVLALRAYAAEQARAFLDADPRFGYVVADGCHQMRVAARRLRSMLGVFGTLMDGEWARSLADELRWINGVLAGESDRQVVLERLGRDLDELGDSDGARRARHLVQRRLGREVSRLHADAVVALTSARYRTLADRLSVLGDQLPSTDAGRRPCSDALPPAVLSTYRKLSQSVERLDPAGADEEWHQVRFLAKHCRHAAESCVPVFGQPARMLGRQLERVTEILGVHQDAVLAAQAAQDAAATPRIAASTSFVLGVLHATERAAVASARRDLGDVWPEVSGKRWRRWLTRG
jgi:CHAD domain-containing protein